MCTLQLEVLLWLSQPTTNYLMIDQQKKLIFYVEKITMFVSNIVNLHARYTNGEHINDQDIISIVSGATSESTMIRCMTIGELKNNTIANDWNSMFIGKGNELVICINTSESYPAPSGSTANVLIHVGDDFPGSSSLYGSNLYFPGFYEYLVNNIDKLRALDEQFMIHLCSSLSKFTNSLAGHLLSILSPTTERRVI